MPTSAKPFTILDKPPTHAVDYFKKFTGEEPSPSTLPLSASDACYHDIPSSPRRRTLTEMHPPPVPPASEPPAERVPPYNEEGKSDRRKGKRRMEEDRAVTSDSHLSAAPASKVRKRTRRPRGRASASNDLTREWDFKNSEQHTYVAGREAAKRGRKTSSSSLETISAPESSNAGAK